MNAQADPAKAFALCIARLLENTDMKKLAA